MNYDENGLEQEFQRYAESVRQQEEAMTDPIQAFTAAKNAIDGLRILKNYGEEIADISKRGEFMRVIGELSMELAETQLRLSEQIRENDSLKGRIIDLEL
jgi:hypothetical protein